MLFDSGVDGAVGETGLDDITGLEVFGITDGLAVLQGDAVAALKQ